MLKEKLKKNQVSYGTWIQIPSPVSAEILSSSNFPFDWICVDLEHGIIDLEMMTNIFRSITNRVPIARIPINEPVWIHRVLDAGAMGIIIPMVCNSYDAIRAIDETKYSPEGRRSFGYCRANKYGIEFNNYFNAANNDISVILQIEHIDAIDNIEEILSVSDIDATFIGPYDLSGSMGCAGDFDNKNFRDALDEYMYQSKVYNIPAGIHIVKPDDNNVIDIVNKGYKMIALGTDAMFLNEGSKESLKFMVIPNTEK